MEQFEAIIAHEKKTAVKAKVVTHGKRYII